MTKSNHHFRCEPFVNTNFVAVNKCIRTRRAIEIVLKCANENKERERNIHSFEEVESKNIFI